MIRRSVLVGLLLVAVLAVAGFSSKASAAPAVSLTTSPITINLNLKPGMTSTQTLQVMNNTSHPVQVTTQLKTFGANGSTGEASINNFSPSDPAALFVRLSPASFTAQPGVWNYIKATITLPRAATLGYYYAIVFQPATSQTGGSHVAVIKESNAILLLIDTGAGNEQKNISIANFTISRRIYQYLPASFSVNLRNKGNIYLAPHGDIFISRNANGANTIDTLPVNPGAGNVLPDSNRIFQAAWADGFPVYVPKIVNGQPAVDGKGKPINRLQWNLGNANKFRFGRYYAHLVLVYNNGGRAVLLNATVSFWVIPWLILIVLLVIGVLVAFAVFSIGRSIYRRFKRR